MDDAAREFLSLALATGVPVGGVLLLGWDAHSVMFILSWEMITTSALLAWLFNYPARSTAAGVALVAVLAPIGLMMWVLLAESHGQGVRDTGSSIAALARTTWISLALTTLHAAVAFHRRTRLASAIGTAQSTNDRILLQVVGQVFLPFAVFAGIMVAETSLGSWTLAGVLTIKSTVDLLFSKRRLARIRGAS